jgi:hypothetical protein
MDPNVKPDTPAERNRSSQVTTGLLLIALGLLFFADRQGWAWGWHLSFGRLWPLLLIVSGITRVIVPVERTITDQSGQAGVTVRRYRLGSGFWLVAIGALMLLHVNRVLSLRESWPLFIVAGGLSMMFGDDRKTRRRRER